MANSQAPFLPSKWNGGLPPPRNHSEERSTNPPSLAQGIGNGTNNLRPEGNIWSTAPHSASVTRESSRNRELGQYQSMSRDAMDGRKGSASLIASSEVEPSGRPTRPGAWRDTTALHMRSSDMRSGTSPSRRGSGQLQQGSALLNNMQAFPQYSTQSRVSLSAIGSRSANGSYSAASGSTGPQLLETMNGFNPFNRSSEDSGRPTEWADSGSVHSPTDERRPIAEYFGSGSSTAASRNGSLPGSRQSNDPGSFATSDAFSQFGHAGPPNRGHNPSFSSQSSGRMHSDRQPSQSSDIANLVEDLHLGNGSDFITTALFNQNPSGPSFRRQPRHEAPRNYNGVQINGGSSTPDGWPNSQSDILLGAMSTARLRDRGGLTPNSVDYKQNSYASTGGTPPSYDPLYAHNQQMRPQITDAGLLDNRLQRLEQLQQREQRFSQQPFPPILPYRQFNPYPNQYALANGLSVPPVHPSIPLNSAIPTFYQPPGIMPAMESSRVPTNDSTSIQSAVLNEFKLTQKSRRWELKVSKSAMPIFKHPNHSWCAQDIKGHFVEFSGDQAGSRFIQTMLSNANSDEKQMIFEEILPNAMQLMQDVFGNYVIQKFFEHGDQTQKKVLGNRMEGSVITLSTSTYGCRVVQKVNRIPSNDTYSFSLNIIGPGTCSRRSADPPSPEARERRYEASQGPERKPRHSEGDRTGPTQPHRIYLRRFPWPGLYACQPPVWLPCYPADPRVLRKAFRAVFVRRAGASPIYANPRFRPIRQLCSPGSPQRWATRR